MKLPNSRAVTARARRTFSRAATVAAICVALGASFCGPELTTPGDTNIGGTWFAAGPAAGMTNITMVLTQSADGHISGTFTATGTPGQQACLSTGPCALSSTIDGVNTVLQINLVLTGGGTFTGQALSSSVLRGTMSQGENTLVAFNRTGP
jgi:hypothetical protein